MKAFLVLSAALLIGSSISAEEDTAWSVLAGCSSSDIQTCLQIKLATYLDRAAKSRELTLVPGLALARTDGDAKQTSDEPLTEDQIVATLPRSLDDKETALDTIIADKLTDFLSTHSLQLKLNEFAPQEEGRSKRRRTMTALMLMFMMTAGTVIPIKLGTLALLAGKALIISKLALALAAIVGLKKLLSSHDEHDSYQVVHGHRRNMETEAAHDMAYSAQKPQ